jgi:hypothetical protein
MKQRWMALLVAPLVALALSSCRVEQTREGEAPDIDVQGGQTPRYEIEPADVDIRMEERTVEVPTIDVRDPDSPRDTVIRD